MVRGARSGSSFGRRSSRGRGLFAASASGSSSVPPPLAAGLGEFTPPHPRVPAFGPSSVPPPVAACSGEFTPPPPRLPGSDQCTPSPPIVVGPSVSAPPAFLAGASMVPEAEDAISLQEGGGSFYESTLREVWINGDKIESTQASQFITRTIQAHFPGPIHRFNDFPMEVQEWLYQMFMVATDRAQLLLVCVYLSTATKWLSTASHSPSYSRVQEGWPVDSYELPVDSLLPFTHKGL
ncbi:hypothetical protein Taro_036410 [Colocasia esculenta]|uniref:Uncharacterized protein n=1 Tax=Colocasia esculenta TaxID=4460 RepID=A0A843WHS4_COLES|nr:hypothetical protein [Colocasia esculenta]